jgi:hypothetical protein
MQHYELKWMLLTIKNGDWHAIIKSWTCANIQIFNKVGFKIGDTCYYEIEHNTLLAKVNVSPN